MAHIQKLGMMNMVMEERGKLTEVAKELIGLLDGIEKEHDYENTKYIEIRKKTLDLLKHLTNIAGFCDKDSQNKIREVNELVTMSLEETVHFSSLRKICGIAVGLQLDFNKSPFMMIELDVNALNNEFKNMFKK
jgi:hypothetical protein